jgi:cation:H+ antiporter
LDAGSYFISTLFWLGGLIVASFFLSNGAESLSHFFGGKFVGRTLLSIATTLPEIIIVFYASKMLLYDFALGSALGSNILMMSLGLSIMVLIATTKLSKKPVNEINVEGFRTDMIFLILTAIAAVAMFIDGYSIIDGFIFLGFFIVYVAFAFYETRKSKNIEIEKKPFTLVSGGKAIIFFIIGTIGTFLCAEPFIHSIEKFAGGIGVTTAVIAVMLSPLAGEMPEKISVMMLARRGKRGVSISIANVLGSKVLNNTLLLSIMIFGATLFHGLDTVINPNGLLRFQVYWTGILTILAVSLMFDRKLTLSDGVSLSILYVASIGLQFVLLGFI